MSHPKTMAEAIEAAIVKKAEEIAYLVEEFGRTFPEAIAEAKAQSILGPKAWAKVEAIASGMIDEAPEDFCDRMIGQLREMK